MSRSADIGAVRSDTGFNEWEALKAVTQDTRANVITDIVGHPKGMPSMKELDYMNPSVSRSTISVIRMRGAGSPGVVRGTGMNASAVSV